MVINITSEIQKAFDGYLDEAVDWDFVGTPITRRMLAGSPASIVDYAAGWQASRKQALESAMNECQALFSLSGRQARDGDPFEIGREGGHLECLHAIRSLEGNAKETT